MLEVQVAGLAFDSAGQAVVLLRPVNDAQREKRLLPIWIGGQEATAIMLALDETAPPRPMSYDLMVRILSEVGAGVEHVTVTRLEEGTYFAEISLTTADGLGHTIDARPSDSIALAVRVGAALFVAEAVFEEAAILDEIAAPALDDASAEDEMERFRSFLDSVDPDEFRG